MVLINQWYTKLPTLIIRLYTEFDTVFCSLFCAFQKHSCQFKKNKHNDKQPRRAINKNICLRKVFISSISQPLYVSCYVQSAKYFKLFAPCKPLCRKVNSICVLLFVYVRPFQAIMLISPYHIFVGISLFSPLLQAIMLMTESQKKNGCAKVGKQ